MVPLHPLDVYYFSFTCATGITCHANALHVMYFSNSFKLGFLKPAGPRGWPDIT
jgi:hypothetical protein